MQQINNLSKHIKKNESLIKNALNRVLDSGWLVLGPEVLEFERSFAGYVGASYCVSVANGTDALELGLRAVGIQQNDKVATVANAGFYTGTALLAIGASPLYMDVDLDSRVVKQVEIERVIKEGVKAIVITHLYGQALLDIEAIASVCHAAGVSLVEDCAQAHGAKIDGKHVGSFGDIGCFSFYPTKNLGALGDGGAVVTNTLALAERVSCLRQYGWTSKYQVGLAGARNSRLDEMQAAILTEFLPHLDSWNARRRDIASIYSTQIKNSSVILPPVGDAAYVAHLYVIRTKQRSDLQTYLREHDISTDIHYPIPDNCQSVFCDRFTSVSLPNTEQLAKETLTIPCYPEMTDDEVQQVVLAINSWQS